MQVGGALQGGRTIPWRGRLQMLLGILAIVVVVALVVRAGALVRSGVGAKDANPSVGADSAVLHDDAGYVHRSVGSAVIHDDVGNVHPD